MISFLVASLILIITCSSAQDAGNEQSGRVALTSLPTNLVVGQPYEIKWEGGGSGGITLTLKAGPPDDIHTVLVIAHSVSGNAYKWTPPKSLAARSDYALQLSLDSDPSENNYSGQFTITNPAGTTSSPAPASKTDSTPIPSASGTNESNSKGSTASGVTASIPPSSSTTPSPPSVTPTSSASSSPQRSSSSQVSTTKLGIGLGVPLGVLILAMLAFAAFWMHRRRANRASQSAYPKIGDQSPHYGPMSEMDTTSKGGTHMTVEMDGMGVPFRSHELQGSPGVKRYELPARNRSKP